MTRAVIWCAVSSTAQTLDGKESLPSQERDGLAAADRLGLQVVATLKVPGFSRDYLDIHECAQDMQAAGISAMRDLLALMQANAFEVLICRDADRFGRTQSLISYITEYIVKRMNARIYTYGRGQWVDGGNFRMWAAMSGFQAASELDTFRARRRIGMQARVQKGLPSSKPPISHTYERDTRGKPIRLIVDESKRRLLDDLFALYVEQGIAMRMLSKQLAELGHLNPTTGKPFGVSAPQKWLYNPFFWGHSAEHYRDAREWGFKSRWAYDESAPLPAGVTIYRNTHEAAYTGEQALRIQNEMQRRERASGGQRGTQNRYPFTGILICGKCGYRMAGHTQYSNGKVSYFCQSFTRRKFETRTLPECHNRSIREEWLLEATRAFLEAAFSESDGDSTQTRRDHTAALEVEIKDRLNQLEEMVREQADRRGPARVAYANQIDALSDQIERLQAALAREKAAHAATLESDAKRNLALSEIKALDIDRFMALAETDKRRFNQLLRILIHHITATDGALDIHL